jgi:hypothetical protein
VEAAVTTTASNVEKFSRGEAVAVGVDRIERELVALWQAAAGRAETHGAAAEAGGASPVARAALWNVILPIHGAASLARTKQLVDDLAPSIPARVIMLVRDTGGEAVGIQATIESNVVSRPSGARVVYSEEITLTGHHQDEEHFGPLVRSLQIPSLPTATFWIDSIAIDALLTDDLLPLSDRLVVNTGCCASAAELSAVARLAATSRADVGDLGWIRLAGFRLLFAGLFDPPVGGGPLLAARRITIEHRPRNVASALLLGAWLGCQLDWRSLDAAALPPDRDDGGASGGWRFRFAPPAERGPDAAPIELHLRCSAGECGTSGIVAITLETQDAGRAGGSTYTIRRTANNHAEISVPIAPSKSIKLDSRSDTELCVGALGPGGRDPLLRRVLAYAGRLADLVVEQAAR